MSNVEEKGQSKMAKTGKFIRFYGGMYLYGKAVALHETPEPGVFQAIAETSGGKSLGRKLVTQKELDAIEGNHAECLAQLLDMVSAYPPRFYA